jgi:exodeoxyribonuclease VII small subunit
MAQEQERKEAQMANETMTFKEAYGVLQGHAETLRNQSEPNIDDLLSIVEESVSAYRVCKERIDAVEKALEKALTDVGAEAVPRSTGEDEGGRAVAAPRVRAAAPAPGAAAPAAQKPAAGFDDMDDDIPF